KTDFVGCSILITRFLYVSLSPLKSVMRYILKYGLLLWVWFPALMAMGQNQMEKAEEAMFIVRGSVRESDTYRPIPEVNIEVNGGAYTMTGQDGNFNIKVKKGDELVIRHKDFETIYYTITSDERI